MLAAEIEAPMGDRKLVASLPAFAGTTVLIGPNGAGKSTLLKCLLGVVKPSRGTILLGGDPLFDATKHIDVPTEHRRLGYVPQRYALFSHMSVVDNVGFGIRGVSRSERRDRARALLADLAIEHLATRRTPSLSGGEAQRVALARALAIEPRALLLDEPMAALDAGARRRVRAFLGERLQSIGIPTIVVSHDRDDLTGLAERAAVLEDGRIVQVGAPDEVRDDPRTPFVRELFGTE